VEKGEAAVPGARGTTLAAQPKRPSRAADTSSFDRALLILHSSADTIERARALRAASQLLKVQATSLRAQLAVLADAVSPKVPSELEELGELLKEFDDFLLALEGYSRGCPEAGIVDEVASTGMAMLKAMDELLDAWATDEPVVTRSAGSLSTPLPDLAMQEAPRRRVQRFTPV